MFHSFENLRQASLRSLLSPLHGVTLHPACDTGKARKIFANAKDALLFGVILSRKRIAHLSRRNWRHFDTRLRRIQKSA